MHCPSEPIWIEERDAITLHGRLLNLHGGAAGLRDRALLQSALARPRHLLAYMKPPSVPDMAAAYAAGIIRNHPFMDGNKRTGFVIAALFLELNGYRLNATEEDATQAVLALAAGMLDEAAFSVWLKRNVKHSSNRR